MRAIKRASAFVVTLAAVVVPLLATQCSQSSGGAADGGSLNLGGLYVSLLPLQPASNWMQNAGTINPVCATPNPIETGFTDLTANTGVELSTASNQAQ